MTGQKSVLLLTNSEYGQANVVLALAHELLVHRSELDIHIASFPALRERVAQLQTQVRASSSSDNDLRDRTITFHAVGGLSMEDAWTRSSGDRNVTIPHPPGIGGAIPSYPLLVDIVVGWDGPEYIQGYKSCVDIIKEVDPAMVVVESGFSQGLDACRTIPCKHIIVTPNSLRELVASIQPWLAIFWKYPALSSGFSFPVPWSLLLVNIYLNLRLVWAFVFSPRLKMLDKYRKEQGISGTLPVFAPYSKNAHYLCPSVPEMDLPCVIPENVSPCGPLLLAVPPIEQSDPGMLAWLRKGPTILVNLGTHMNSSPAFARELASAVSVILERRLDVQVLWKLKSEEEGVDERVLQLLGEEISSGRVRIEEWLVVDPLAILQSGHVICSVHHGGANSYNEATCVGVPQIVLPVWYDTYDYANRVESLGIGVYGNRSVAPMINAKEFSQAVMAIVGDTDKAKSIRRRAEEVAKICQRAGGRALACEKIVEHL